MSQENYTIIPLMGVDQSGNVAMAPTPNTFTIGLNANPVSFTGANTNAFLTVPTPSNFVVGQTITIAGGVGNISGVTPAQYGITTQVTSVNATTIGYTAGAAAGGAATGGGTAMTLSTIFTPTDFKPLERLVCSDGTTRMLVKGTVATINAGDMVIVDASGNAQQSTTALLTPAQTSAAYTIANAPYSITYSASSPNYGWVIVNGPCQINVAANTAVGTALYTTTTAGRLSTTNAASYLVLGALTTATSATAGPVSGILTNPTLGINSAGSL